MKKNLYNLIYEIKNNKFKKMNTRSRRLDDNEEIETVTTKKVIKKSKRVNNSINPMESQIKQSQWEGESFSGDEERKKNKILNMIKNAHIEKIKNGVLLREINNAHDEIQRFKYEGDLASAKMMENTLNDLHATVVFSNINPLTKSKLWKTANYNNPFSSFNQTKWDKSKTMYKTMNVNVNEQNLYEFSKTTKTKKGKKNNMKTEKIEEEENVQETQINKSKKSGTRKSKNKSVNTGNNGNNVNNNNNNFDNKGNINGDNVGYDVRGSIYNNKDKDGGYDNSGNIYDNDPGNRMVDNNGNIIIIDNDKKMNDNLRNNPNSVMNEQGNVVIPGNKKNNQYQIGHNEEIIVNEINVNENEDTTTKKKKKKKTKKKVIKKGKDGEKDENLDLDGRPQQYDDDVDYDNQGEEEEEEDEIDVKREKPLKETVISEEFSVKDSIDIIAHSMQNPQAKQDLINPNHLSQNPIVSQSQTPTNPIQDKNPSLDPNKVTNPKKSQPEAEDPNKKSLNPNTKTELTNNPLHPNPQQPGPQYQNPIYSNPQQGNPQLSNPQNPNPQYDKPRNPNDVRGYPDTRPSIPKKRPNRDKYAPRTKNPKTRVDYDCPLCRNPERPLGRERGVEPRVRPSSAQRHIINHPYYRDTHSDYPKRPILNFGKPLSFYRSQKKRKKRREGIESFITYGNDRRGKCFACDVNCGISVSGNSPSNYNPYKASLKYPRTEKNYYYNEYYQYKSKYY